ncbi:Mis12-Mtw1 protein family-domain-containing protein [Chaetomium sp. MPI-SDFR-AT-0129]|nr:Mis12-Mtw1 protein family-domain-containing protein [Chaetomium sp. MPI-SDFR-AT-0129]
MTTLVQTRQPLQVLSIMSNQPERRQSKRLAGGTSSLPLLPSRPAASSSSSSAGQSATTRTTTTTTSKSTGKTAAAGRGRKRKDTGGADATDPPSSSSAAAAVYDEQDGDFLFTRESKRVKTTPAPVPEEDEDGDELGGGDFAPAPVPVKRGVGRPPKAATARGRGTATGSRRVATSSPAAATPTPPLPAQSAATGRGRAAAVKAAAAGVVPPSSTARRKPSKRKQSLDEVPPRLEEQEEEEEEAELVVPKSRTRRKAQEPVVEKKAPGRGRPGRASQVNGTGASRRIEPEDEEEEQQQQHQPPHHHPRKQATPGSAAHPHPHPHPAHTQSQMIALPFSDTPVINRNKEFRKKAGGSGAGGGRRSSLGMRGRRASSLIDNGHSALPHREVDPAEFYKYISADGLSEPRRMKQLLIWCGERALSAKPPHGRPGSSAILGARAIQDQLLKDFGARSEFSDWFAREDVPKPPVPVVLQPNPRNVDYDAKIAELEARIQQLKTQKAAWQAIAAPLPTIPPLYPDPSPQQQPPPTSSANSTSPKQQKQQPPLHTLPPDPTLLSPPESTILSSLTQPPTSFSHFKRQARSRLQNAQAALELAVDRLADGVHKLDARVDIAEKEAEVVLAVGAGRLRAREERERREVGGVGRGGVLEVLRSLGRILPEGG